MRDLARYALAFDLGILAGLLLAQAWRDYRTFTTNPLGAHA